MSKTTFWNLPTMSARVISTVLANCPGVWKRIWRICDCATTKFYLLSVIVGVDIVEDLKLRGAARFRDQCVEDHLPRQGTIPEKKSISII